MAVTFKGESSQWASLLVMLGVGQALITKADLAGVEVEQSSPGTFVIKYGGTIYGVVPVKGQAITLAKEGKLGPASKQALQFQFTQAIEKALAYAISKAEPTLTTPITPVKSGASGFLQAAKEALDTPLTSKPSWGDSVSGGSNKSIIPLVEAKEVYQKVLGTSANSIYVVCVLFQGMALAIRRKGTKLSLRVEGQLSKYSVGLITVGFELHDGYGSVHFNISDLALLKKTIGAVVGAVGLTSVLAVGDVDKAITLCS